MNRLPSSPPQPSVTTLDKPPTHTIKSTSHVVPTILADHSTKPDTDAPPSFQQPPAPPTRLDSSLRNSSINISTMSLVQSNLQPNTSLQSLNTTPASFHSNSSCLSPSLASSVSSAGSGPAKASPHSDSDSGIASPAPLPMKSQQSITPSFSFPGAPSSGSSLDTGFPSYPDSQYSLTSAPSAGVTSDDSPNTPNVYINGLPPNFSERDLFALARPFGDIKSVRTFTRHVSEKPTGYGFVLFADIKSACDCIEGLRKHRNLHPSFSKLVHRIPGTEYAQHNTAMSSDEKSFKSRMEKLKDTASTNLYIEGLPLSIDEESLAALMLPYKIKSSRFFKTKLSNPPRIIAFVRLETRAAAEETIERLHGRMVRGWNDSGCRISVRFADSSDQRELRRTERSLKNGDQSPSRLTIAQAALLNLRGQEYQSNVLPTAENQPQHTPITLRIRPDTHAPSKRVTVPGVLPTSLSLPSNLYDSYQNTTFVPTANVPLASDMDALIRSIQNMGYDDGSVTADTLRSTALENEYLFAQQAQIQALANAALVSSNVLRRPPPRTQTRAHNGFTPAEELVFEAHAQRLQLQAQTAQPTPALEELVSSRVLNANVRGFEPALESVHAAQTMLSQDALPVGLEEQFHAMGHLHQHFAPSPHEFQGSNGYLLGGSGATSTLFVRPPSRAVNIVPPPPDYEEHAKRSKGQPSVEPKHIHHHPSSRDDRQSNAIVGLRADASYLQAPIRNHISNSNNSNTSAISRAYHLEHSSNYSYPHGHVRGRVVDDNDHDTHLGSLPSVQVHTHKSPLVGGAHVTSNMKEGPKSPAMVSPALTYCSRTPSTLSPATPFFGSFTGNQDVFDVVTMENEDAVERKLKARGVGK